MNELMNRLCGGLLSYREIINEIEELIEKTNKDNYYHCIVYLLVLKEQIVDVLPEEESTFRAVFERLKSHAVEISGEDWVDLIKNSYYMIQKEEKVEENKSVLLVNLVVETLIRASTADIERAVEVYLEEEMSDPRTQEQKNISVEVIEEILDNLSKVSENEARKQIKTVCKLIGEEHIDVILSYIDRLSKVLLLSLYVNNRKVYTAVQKEYFKREFEHSLILADFPEIDIEELLRKLYKNSTVFKILDKIMKTRPIHRERIVEEVIKYIKTGSRTKTIQFIRENIACFISKIRELGLGCEEVLLLAEKQKSLLQHVFAMISELRVELKDKKKVFNIQKKEKRVATLISALSTDLSHTTEEEIEEFIVRGHEIDSELLSKICINLFRIKQPSELLRNTLSKLVQKETTTAFVFTSMPYLPDDQKYELIEEYLHDDVSLTLFIRMLKPQDIFVYAHTLKSEAARRIIDLCYGKEEVFTDRVVSVSIEEMTKLEVLPPLFLHTVRRALKLFSNMKPFVASLIGREWPKLFEENREELIELLEGLGVNSAEILLTVSEDDFIEVLSASESLKKKVEEYLEKQPKYIQSKYKGALRNTKRTKRH